MVEKLISEGLRDLGFRIIEKNYKTPFGEIDLLSSYKNQMFMIEVKAVSEIDMLDRLNRSGQKTRLVNIYHYLNERSVRTSNKASYGVANLRTMLIVVERKSKEVIVYLDYLSIE